MTRAPYTNSEVIHYLKTTPGAIERAVHLLKEKGIIDKNKYLSNAHRWLVEKGSFTGEHPKFVTANIVNNAEFVKCLVDSANEKLNAQSQVQTAASV